MGPVVQGAGADMQVEWCPREPSLPQTTRERHIRTGISALKSKRFEDSMETGEMES